MRVLPAILGASTAAAPVFPGKTSKFEELATPVERHHYMKQINSKKELQLSIL